MYFKCCRLNRHLVCSYFILLLLVFFLFLLDPLGRHINSPVKAQRSGPIQLSHVKAQWPKLGLPSLQYPAGLRGPRPTRLRAMPTGQLSPFTWMLPCTSLLHGHPAQAWPSPRHTCEATVPSAAAQCPHANLHQALTQHQFASASSGLVACPSSGQPRLVTPDSPPGYCPRPLPIAPHLHTQLKHSSAPPGYHEPAHLRAWHLPRQHSSSALSPSTCPLWSASPLQVASLAATTGGLCNAQLLISHAVSSLGAFTPTSTRAAPYCQLGCPAHENRASAPLLQPTCRTLRP